MSSSPGGKIPKTNSSVHDIKEDTPPFGSRFLTDGIMSPLQPIRQYKLNERSGDREAHRFQKMHTAGKATVVEVGCESNQNPDLSIIGCDYSSKAIDVVKAHPLYSAPHIGSVSACVWDLSGPNLPLGVDSGTVDIVVMVFVLSALHPDEWASAIRNVYSMLKPGGLVVLRDYGRYDLTQLRFKEGRLLDDNFYVRGDGTRVYFFDLDELALLFTGAKAPTKDSPNEVVVTSSVADTSSLDPEGTNGTATPSVEPDPVVDITNTGNTPTLSRGLSGSGTPHNKAAINVRELVGLERALDQVSVAEVRTQPPAPEEGQIPAETRAPLNAQASASLSEGECTPKAESPLSITDLSRAQASAVETSTALGVPHPLFTISGMGVDRRLLVNRKRQLQMYRVRHILATTSQLQETVRCLEARVAELEAALAESHAMHSPTPHPLLQDHRTTQSQTTNAPSTYVPYGQLVPSPPAITIPSTSPSAHSPTYVINNTTPDASQMQQPFNNPYDLDLPQRPLSSGGNASSSSSSDFPATYVPSSAVCLDSRILT
ncbi:hypothetical protein FRC06_010382 [Ceratobasidium sp. 370]|nr:hypothetical protein FRC06_010382 [Ceratobasidium sp. 370]